MEFGLIKKKLYVDIFNDIYKKKKNLDWVSGYLFILIKY